MQNIVLLRLCSRNQLPWQHSNCISTSRIIGTLTPSNQLSIHLVHHHNLLSIANRKGKRGAEGQCFFPAIDAGFSCVNTSDNEETDGFPALANCWHFHYVVSLAPSGYIFPITIFIGTPGSVAAIVNTMAWSPTRQGLLSIKIQRDCCNLPYCSTRNCVCG